ncbi:DNA (cytosine-5-)-methyltransferase [Corynebacterium anserum]|uniref:Cytosine-specific methyltransferase n=1 Tax=Corynebacterium anserum TaxID=2684406 RepID=A0A7G7YLH7_9CORY|nr:DNA (cytosine-5-)-methyltransferase [Corynebacterium anserum]MBC2682576.1 DNA (cytosine-5-)-methyltransferase [Corynebacterium anserum]QNH95347.1 DNA (cytosine-5-)-methyltransferase [Corynebacterium anserum]
MVKLQISEAAEKLDVSVDTIRRWEKKGLIKSQRNSANYREFDFEEINRLYRKLNGEPSGYRYTILKNPVSKFTAVDLFAGAGGTALGLENAGFRHLAVNEIDKWAADTLRVNRPHWNVIEGDIHEISFPDLEGKVNLVEGGFPCQAFSYAGNKLGFADTRGTLFHEFARIVSELRPEIAMGENVRGLVNHDGGRTLKTMLKQLQDIGYRVAYKMIRAQYLDVPQKRERLIIIAVRNDLDYPILFPKEKDYTVSLKDSISDVPEGPGMVYNEWKFKIMDKVPEGGNWRDLKDEDQRAYMKASYYLGGGKTGLARRLSWDEPSLTLTCNPAQKQTERCHPSKTRPLNVREYARIQSFPDEWTFQGSVSQQYKQIGNAVPVNLAFHVGTGLRAMLEGKTLDTHEEQKAVPALQEADLI